MEEQADSVLRRIQTQCVAVDTLTDGGLATGTITQIFGEKALGKSIISFQAACATLAGGASAIILDTEQSYSSYLMPYWKGSMARRFGKEVKVADLKAERVPKSEKKNKTVTRGQLITELGNTLNRLGVVYTESHLGSIANTLSPEFDVKLEEGTGPSVMVMQVPEVTDLLNLHGIDAAKEVSEGGRVELRLRATPTYQSVLHQIIRKTNAKLLVYDSISAPFKASFPSTQDLPARSAGMAMILAHSQRLCVEFGIAVLVISHVSIDPIKAWDRVPYGGVILGHEAKFSLELTKATAKRNQFSHPEAINPEEEDGAAKAFWVARHPAMAEYSKYGYAKIDGGGVPLAVGWLFKGFLVLVALSMFAAGLWPLSLIIFVYLAFSLRPRRQKVERTVLVTPPGGVDGGGQAEWSGKRSRLGFEWRWRYLLGGVFLLAALLAVASHGTYSPLVFGGLGVLSFLWAPLSRSGHIPAAGFSPLRDSTLLRNVLVPFQWLVVVELKLSGQESMRALSVLHDNLVVIAPASEKPSAYLVVKDVAVGYRSAEARMSERLRKLAGLLANRGVYLMPLDSVEAARRFRPGFEPLRMDLNRESVIEVVGHSPYDVLVVKPDGGHAESLGAYRVDPSTREGEMERVIAGGTGSPIRAEVPAGRAALPPARSSFERPPLLWEVIACLQERFRFSDPDGYTMFLNNMHVSRGVPAGVKMSLANGAADGQTSNGSTLTVESLGGAPVELTRAQLRMIVKMYD